MILIIKYVMCRSDLKGVCKLPEYYLINYYFKIMHVEVTDIYKFFK